MISISVVIPAYNQARYIGDAIRSVLSQTRGDFELVVVDDGSTDGTAEVARSFADSRLRCIRQENGGLSAARNTGIRSSSAPFLTFLDSDDMFFPRKLELLAEALEKNPDAGIAAGQAVPVDEEGRRAGAIFDRPLPVNSAELLLGNPLHVGSVMLRRSWQEKAGLFDESLRSYEDWDMWLRLALAGCRPVWVAEPVSYYRFHQAQMTRIGNQMTAASFAVLDKLFSRRDLPESWVAQKPLAYSRAHLRAAAQAFLARAFDAAGDHLVRAAEQNPALLDREGALLAGHFRAWTELPKVRDAGEFLDSIYSHLPPRIRVRRESRGVGKKAKWPFSVIK